MGHSNKETKPKPKSNPDNECNAVGFFKNNKNTKPNIR